MGKLNSPDKPVMLKFQFDISERLKKKITFNALSQRNTLVEIAQTEGHDDVYYIYNTLVTMILHILFLNRAYMGIINRSSINRT